MAFQSTVYNVSGAGVPGEQANDSPLMALPYSIDSASAAYNIIGKTMCTITNENYCQAGSAGAGGFAGLLVNPKVQALYGASGQPLAPSMTVNDQDAVECATMGTFWVTLPAAAAIGDWVIYNNTTGAIATIPRGDEVTTGYSWGYAYVSVKTVTGAGLGIITLDPGFQEPYVAPAP